MACVGLQRCLDSKKRAWQSGVTQNTLDPAWAGSVLASYPDILKLDRAASNLLGALICRSVAGSVLVFSPHPKRKHVVGKPQRRPCLHHHQKRGCIPFLVRLLESSADANMLAESFDSNGLADRTRAVVLDMASVIPRTNKSRKRPNLPELIAKDTVGYNYIHRYTYIYTRIYVCIHIYIYVYMYINV